MSACAALALLALMFTLKWYGVDGIPGHSALYRTVNAWEALSVIRWLMLATILVAVITPLVHAAAGPSRGSGALVAALSGITALLLAYRVLIELPDSNAVLDQKLGAYLGLLAAVAIAVGSYDAVAAIAARARSEAAAASRAGARTGPLRTSHGGPSA